MVDVAGAPGEPTQATKIYIGASYRTLCRVLLLALGNGAIVGCGSSGDADGSTGAGGSSASGTTTGIVITMPDGGQGGANGDLDGGGIIGTLPPDFTKTEVGGFKLGPPVMGGGADTGQTAGACNRIVGAVRDFKGFNVPGGHADFEHFAGGGTKGLVEADLGADLKPVYTGACEAAGSPKGTCPDGQMTTGKGAFDQWYRFTDGVNQPYLIYFFFQGTPGQSVITFDSQYFFPLDAAGWQAPGTAGGDTAQTGNDGKAHNFAFTTELHTKFKYGGGETFTFDGDDDLWVFINKKLAIDLGGLHPSLKSTVNLDASAAALGITIGNTYPIDLFHAERHTTASHFRVETTLSLVDCGSIPPDVPK